MPVRDQLARNDLPQEGELRAALEAELRAPHAEGEPVIVIERPNPSTSHVFVIWFRFDGFEQTVRSRLVLDAYLAAKGEPEAMKVTVAMGLTPAEATRMGIG